MACIGPQRHRKKEMSSRRDPRTKANEHKTRVLISFTIICKTFLILRIIERVPLFLSDFNET